MDNATKKPAPIMKPPLTQATLKPAPLAAPAATSQPLVAAAARTMHSHGGTSLQTELNLVKAENVTLKTENVTLKTENVTLKTEIVTIKAKIQDLEDGFEMIEEVARSKICDRRARIVDRRNDVNNDINTDRPKQRARSKRDKGGSSSGVLYHASRLGLEAPEAAMDGSLDDDLKQSRSEGSTHRPASVGDGEDPFVPLYVVKERKISQRAFQQFVHPNSTNPATMLTFGALAKRETVAAADGKDSAQPTTALKQYPCDESMPCLEVDGDKPGS